MTNNIFTVLSDEEIDNTYDLDWKQHLPEDKKDSYEYKDVQLARRKAIAATQIPHTLQQVIKLYEDMALVPEEDSPYYTFWLELKALVAKVKEG